MDGSPTPDGPRDMQGREGPTPWPRPGFPALPGLTGEPQAVTRPASPRKACPPRKEGPAMSWSGPRTNSALGDQGRLPGGRGIQAEAEEQAGHARVRRGRRAVHTQKTQGGSWWGRVGGTQTWPTASHRQGPEPGFLCKGATDTPRRGRQRALRARAGLASTEEACPPSDLVPKAPPRPWGPPAAEASPERCSTGQADLVPLSV